MKHSSVGVLTLLLLIPAVLFVSCRHPTGPGTVLLMDDFNNENNGVGVFNWTSFQHWDVVSGCVDLHGNGFHDTQPGNGLYVDLDGTCEMPGTLQSKTAFDLRPASYVLQFRLAGNHRNVSYDTLDVSLGALYQRRFILPPDQPFTLYAETVTVGRRTSARLRFEQHGGDEHGVLLNDVLLKWAD